MLDVSGCPGGQMYDTKNMTTIQLKSEMTARQSQMLQEYMEILRFKDNSGNIWMGTMRICNILKFNVCGEQFHHTGI